MAAVQEPNAEDTGFGSPSPNPDNLGREAAKHLNFNDDKSGVPPSEEPCTPAPAVASAGTREDDDDTAVNYNEFMYDTIMWKNKIRSILYLVGGLLFIGSAYQLLFSSTTLIAGLCYAALAQMALNFCRQIISPAFQEKCTWYDSAWTLAATNNFGSALKAVAALNDGHMNGADASKTLKIGAGLWIISILGRYISAFQLALGLWVIAFTIPKAYSLVENRVHKLTGDIFTKAKDIFLGVDKRVRSVVVVLPILVAGYVLSSVDLAIAVFLLLLYVCTWMHKSQVEMVKRNVLVPVTNTASKLGSQFCSSAMKAARTYDVMPTPTPSKRKRT